MITRLKKIRCWILVNTRWKKYSIGPNFYCGIRVRLWAKKTIQLGRDFYIGRDSQIETDCIIGDYVIFGNHCAIVGRYDHNYQQIGTPIRSASQIRDKDYTWKGLTQITIIEDDVWVGYGSIIMSGVKIAKGSIIAAGSVVTKDVEAYSIYAGVPARKIRNRFESEKDLNEHIFKFNQNKQ